MNNLFKILILILIFCVSCNNDKEKLPKHYEKFNFPETLMNNIDEVAIGTINKAKSHKTIDVYNKEQIILKGSNIIDSCWYVPLETKEESLIGKVDKMLIEDNKFFILDKTHSKDLFVFNLDGKFITRLNKQGRGPGEYSLLWDFSIDSKNKHIIVHDDRMAKLFYYDFNGNHLRTEKTSFRFFNFQHFNSSIYYFLGHSDNKHSIELESHELAVEKNSKLQNLYIPRVETIGAYGLNQQFYRSGEHLSFVIPVTGNSIYSVNNDKIDIKYTIDFGSKSINKSIIEKLPNYANYLSASKDLNFSFFMGQHFETKTKLYFKYVEGYNFLEVIYNKNTGDFFVSKEKEFDSNDPHSVHHLRHAYAIYKEDIFISVKEPKAFIMINKFYKKKYKFKSNALKELGALIKETDNPVLVFHKYKEF